MSDTSESRSGNAFLVIAAVMVLAFGAIIATMLLRNETSGTNYYYVIVAGTQDRLDQGRTPERELPVSLSMKVGDSLEVKNEDRVAHSYSFLTIRPGETVKYTFKTRGEFIGACTVGLHKSVTVSVT
ncbi:MAG: hypothetical protein RLZ84_990 [Actinomycetota bacterium]|jgi:hypothetical protein